MKVVPLVLIVFIIFGTIAYVLHRGLRKDSTKHDMYFLWDKFHLTKEDMNL